MAYCVHMTLPGGGTAIVRMSGKRPEPCRCGKPATKLCDYPMGGRKTCDRPMCADCIGRTDGDKDYCRTHAMLTPRQGSLL